MGWTRTKFDTDGRSIESQSFDGSAPPAPWGTNGNTPYGMVTTAYNSEKTTVTDQASVVHDYSVDGSGRLAQVTEHPATGSLLTTYGYDALDDLVCAAQNSTQASCASQTGQKRTFVYTSLKRLYTATNPESGTSTFLYDNNGNLTNAYDARPSGSNLVYRVYDELNRVTAKTHDDGSTPDVSYTYGIVGTSPAYGIGRLTQVSVPSKSPAANYTAFDPLGRVTASNQTTNGQTYGFSYTYNAASLSSETYPSGRTVTTSYDTANRVSQVAATFPANKTYVSGITYAPHGDFASYGYGNGVGRSATYNPRLQPTAMTDSISGKPNYALQLLPYWGDNATQTVNNNGNLRGLNIFTYAAPGFTTQLNFWEAMTYDGVNRLSSISDSGGWSESFSYVDQNNKDYYGNMWVASATGLSLNAQTPTTATAYDLTANRLKSPAAYDAAGDQLVPLAQGATYSYDEERRMISVTDTPLGTTNYTYDGDGRRILKQQLTSGVTTTYIYDAFGQLASEYNSNSTIITPVCNTCFLSWDHLGSTRMVTDQSGNLIARHDYLPFGGEILSGTGGRTSAWGAPDGVNQKFTGKERDQETGLDYFGARYYGSSMGRFMSPDWSAKVQPVPYAKLDNPQSLNLYSYVGNNPLSRVDPDGHCGAPAGLKPGQTGICVASYIKTTFFHFPFRGDGRDTNPNGGTSRIEARMIADPSKNTVTKTYDNVARSGLGCQDCGPKGSGTNTISAPQQDDKGMHFQVAQDATSAMKPYSGGMISGSIDNHINLDVKSDGSVQLDPGSTARMLRGTSALLLWWGERNLP
jgi:RHS repeat-associated protein